MEKFAWNSAKIKCVFERIVENKGVNGADFGKMCDFWEKGFWDRRKKTSKINNLPEDVSEDVFLISRKCLSKKVWGIAWENEDLHE